MGEKKHKTPQKLRVNADQKGLYEEMQMAKENAEQFQPNKKTR